MLEGVVLFGGNPENAFGKHMPFGPGALIVVPNDCGGGEGHALRPRSAGRFGDKLKRIDPAIKDSGEFWKVVAGGGRARD